MTKELTLEVGARVRLVADLTNEDGTRIYLRRGQEGIVESIQPEDERQEGDCPVEIMLEDGNTDYVDFDDIKVVTSAEDVAKEPKEFMITGQLVVEVTHRIRAASRDAAAEIFSKMGTGLLEDWDELEVMKVKKLHPLNIGEKGFDY